MKLSTRRSTQMILPTRLAIAAVLACGTASARAEFLMAWGLNATRQLGDGTTTTQYFPIVVPTMSGEITFAETGADFSAVVRNGTTYTWGRNNVGQCGIGSTSSSINITAAGSLANAGALSLGVAHGLAIVQNSVVGWGWNVDRQLWDGTTTSRPSPVSIGGLESGVTAVDAGFRSSLAIKNGAVWSWGGSSTAAPTPIAGLESGVTAIAAGVTHAAVLQNGAVKAWGDNQFAQMTGPSTVSNPTTIVGLENGVTELAIGRYHTLALKDGVVFHYGAMYTLGSTYYSRQGPIPATAGLGIVKVAAGELCSFALGADGALYTWGNNNYGMLGIGASVPYVDAGIGIRQIQPPQGFIFTNINTGSASRHALATVDYKTLAGDVNLDSAVDFDDLLPLAQNYGTAAGATWAQGDFDLNGTVDFTDLLTLAQNCSASAQITSDLPNEFVAEWSRALSLVPEPTSLGAAALGITLICRTRRS